MDQCNNPLIDKISRPIRRFTSKCLSVFILGGTFSCLVQASEDDHHHEHHDHHADIEEIVVQATRSRRRLQDETIRVEVLAGEEIEEKLLMRPGNISMMLNEYFVLPYS